MKKGRRWGRLRTGKRRNFQGKGGIKQQPAQSPAGANERRQEEAGLV